MRKTLTVALLGLGLAASFAPLSPASAVCTAQIQDVVDTCALPCGPVNAVLQRYGAHVDCIQ